MSNTLDDFLNELQGQIFEDKIRDQKRIQTINPPVNVLSTGALSFP